MSSRIVNQKSDIFTIMTKLLDIEETKTFLTDFINDNDCKLAFISTFEGGVICSTDINQGRMVVEALSSVWQSTYFPQQWKKMSFEWESAYIVLINVGSWVFGLQQDDPNPSTIGLLRLKAKICAERILSQLE